ncbi:SAM-dependent methyltransferase [Kribbella sp. NPDC048928]|uniref:SAM-dependent methyltransferase n=1 Tax=Kribbella sp. NPDC048928 TaxID=3364111 RepID=UPI0037201742
MTDPAGTGEHVPTIDLSRPSVARVYDLALGGKDNFAVDRQAYEKLVELAPEIPAWARDNRKWLARVVSWLSQKERIGQFLDLGSGLPTAQNTHQIAQAHRLDAKVVYVDNDPIVIRHGMALLVENKYTDFAAADFTEPEQVLNTPQVKSMIDFDRPVGVIEALMLHHIADLDETRRIAAAYVDAIPSGSYVAMSHVCNPRDGSDMAKATDALEERFHESWGSLTFRTPAEITSLFAGLDLIGPGLVPLFEWMPPGTQHEDDQDADLPSNASHILYAGVARKP